MFTGPTLTVNLNAIAANWQMLATQFTGHECAAVVKADAYGLGMLPVAGALEKAGCHTFFVATIDEAITLRAALPDVRILVFHGVQAGEEFAFRQHRIIPVLNSREQLARWRPVAKEFAHAVSALHIDTGMGRLGLQPQEFAALMQRDPDMLADCRVGLLMSHLACGPEANHPQNAAQRDLFVQAAALAPSIPTSLCNSGGMYLGADFHGDLARPGCALYGIAPQSVTSHRSPVASDDAAHATGMLLNPMKHVATWRAPILMLRTLERDQAVGYGATQTLPRGTRIATVASGYADGYLRAASGHGALGYLGAHQVPLVGRVTMDMLCFDVSDVPTDYAREGALVTLLGDADGIRVDDLAHTAGTIGYEVLTRIGPRVARIYA